MAFCLLLIPGMVSEKAFESLALIVKQIHNHLDESCDMHGRCDQLRTYVTHIFNGVSLAESSKGVMDSSPNPAANSVQRPRSVVLGSTSSGWCSFGEKGERRDRQADRNRSGRRKGRERVGRACR